MGRPPCVTPSAHSSRIELPVLEVAVMPEFLIDQIAEASRVRRYHVQAEFQPAFVMEGEIDLEEETGHLTLRRWPDDTPMAEAHWSGRTAVGRRLGSDRWLRLVGLPPLFLLPAVAEILESGSIAEVSEEGPFWLISLDLTDVPAIEDSEEFFREVLGEPSSTRGREYLDLVVRKASQFEPCMELRVDREDPRSNRLVVTGLGEDGATLTIAFGPAEEPVPPMPFDAEEIVDLPGVSVGMLLIDLPTIGGWTQRLCHARWAQRSIDLIENSEAHMAPRERKYADLYATGWSTQAYDDNAAATLDPTGTLHHPTVVGAYYEDHADQPMPSFYDTWFASDPEYVKNKDHYWNQKGYWRDYNHFGGGPTGLDDKWYFSLRGAPPSSHLVGGRYYSARDWGFGGNRINEDLNRLTFTQAIRQYNRYTYDGKRAAYLMLGHVIHLLQDQGQPDHARLVDHAGSSMTEKEAYSTYHYCEFLAGEAALVAAAACWGIGSLFCAAVAFAATYSACKASASSNVVGFERLISLPKVWSLSEVEPAVTALGVLKKADYDEYFSRLSTLSVKKADQRSLTSALGCDTLLLVPPIPGADPGIDVGDKADVAKYVGLTNEIVPQVIALSAGMAEHFVEIVNHPPIAERVAVVQWEPGATPCGFGKLATNAPMHCLRYDRVWEMKAGMRSLVTKTQAQNLSLDRPAYVFVLFGPTKNGTVPELGRPMGRATCRMVGTYPATGEPIDRRITLTEAFDSKVGYYYWGSFFPRNCIKDPYTVQLVFEATDLGPHLSGRTGDTLDSDPGSLAVVDASDSAFGWISYTPGPDKNHSITISKATWTLEVTPQALTLGPRATRSASASLEIRERHLDCQEEPYWGLTKCPVTWKLDPMITLLTGGRPVAPAAVGLSVTLDAERGGGATLTVSIPSREEARLEEFRATGSYRPGKYRVEIDYQVGHPPTATSGTAHVDVTLA